MTACHVMVQVPDRLMRPFAVHIHQPCRAALDLNIDHAPTADERFPIRNSR